MTRRSKKSSKQKNHPVEEPKDLDRFAGSSEEEEEEEEEPSVLSREEHREKNPTATRRTEESEEGDDDDDDSSVEEYNSLFQTKVADDADEQAGALGMASAMSRILGASLPKGKSSVILCKTVTPLQRAARTEKQKEQEQRKKRKANRERNLAALHVPLSVATTATTSAGCSSLLGKELEAERLHRRVATRGVVALFNAIAQHQKKTDVTTTATTMTQPKKEEVQHMTKHGFLDMIKKSAAGRPTQAAEEKTGKKSHTSSPNGHPSTNQEVFKPKWNALQDDYMLNSKLKDWDKESSDEDSSSPPIAENDADDWSDPEVEAKEPVDPPVSKKRRLTAH